VSKKPALGRGLGALIPHHVQPQQRNEPAQLRIEQIQPNPHQPRQKFDDDKLRELAESIMEHGLIQPIVVTQIDDHYQIIAGERRWRAAKIAGLEALPVFIKESTPQQMLELALVENIQRADLNPLEEAEAYAQLMEEFGLTQEVVAQRVGKSRTAIANTLRLLKLPDTLKAALADGQISEGHARALLAVSRPRAQQEALQTVIERGLTVRQTEALARQLAAGPPKPKRSRSPLTPHDKDLLQRFQSKLGTKIEMTRNDTADGGRLVIHFYSDEELQAIFDAILGEDDTL
jgi:ParB family chromosome partitioning protein